MIKIAKPYLEDIFGAIILIEQYLNEINNDKKTFLADTQTQDSVVRRLEIIGEATKRLRNDFRQKYDQIPWRLMTGLRDVLIHEYDEVDLDQIWKVTREDLPILKKQLAELIGSD